MSGTKRFVAYYRISKGTSLLGLEAQKGDVQRYLRSVNGEQIGEDFEEIESGQRNDRPALIRALASCKTHRATLLVAKLDRLSRNAYFISSLIASGVEFVCCDNPHANKMMLQMLSVFAEFERDMISTRIRQALERAKAKGTKLGVNSWDATKHDYRAVLAKARAVKDPRPPSQTVIDLMQHYRSEGLTLRAIAGKLNHDDHRTPKGSIWYASTVRKAMRRADSVNLSHRPGIL